MGMAPRFFGWLSLMAIVATSVASVARPVEIGAGEYEIKAAFVYNFAQYVDWPEDAFPAGNSSVSFCVLGRDPFSGELERLTAAESIGGRSLEFRQVYDVAAARRCHVFFLSANAAANEAALLEALRGSYTLVVGETPTILEYGGAIRLYLASRKVRFEINVEATRAQGLKVSSQLLKLARRVVGAE